MSQSLRAARPAPLSVAVVAALLLALGGLLAIAGPAHATASGCTQLGNWRTDVVCVSVVGSGTYVQTARASFSAPIARPCNTRLYITFFDVNNVRYDQRISALGSGCAETRSYSQTYNKTMRRGRACGAVSINGVLKPGACVSIF